MATIGQTLSAAREKKGVSTSQAAAATRIKVQHIDAIERDDFSGMPAVAYAKGFIRLYAEYLRVNPAPLVNEYMELHAPKERAPLVADKAPRKKEQDFAKKLQRMFLRTKSVPRENVRRVGMGVVIVLAVIVVMMSVKRFAQSGSGEAAKPVAERGTQELDVIQHPPEPYLEGAPGAPAGSR